MHKPSTVTRDSVVVGRSPRMRAIFEFLRVIGDSDSTVLIKGESGTGKEVIADLIHQASPRRDQPMVPVSCALFTETLIESELFGHERGAFTGAVRDRAGRFERAEGGTIFLDDIDDVPLSMQVKLLRVLQNKTIERVGGTRAIQINARVLAGTKRDLRRLVAEGAFREDLHYRLNILPIALPPLRERREDVPLLVEHFMRRFYGARGENPPALSPAVMQAFMRYSWPGNVRELENACERLAQICRCGAVKVGCLSPSILFDIDAANEAPALSQTPTGLALPASTSLDERLREVESGLIRWALTASAGNKSKAAQMLGIKRSTLGDRINRCRECGFAVDVPVLQPSA